MRIRELSIGGAFEMNPTVHSDDRGTFFEWFRADRFREATGHAFTLSQANCSVSRSGTIRGIHYADVPPGQAKYVSCPAGALLDVVVDLRTGSPTFGSWEAVELDQDNRKAVYLAEGLGHAFMALADGTVAHYLCSAAYARHREHGVHPLDPNIAIEWPTTDRAGDPVEWLISERDQAAPRILEAENSGALPVYEQTLDYVQSLARLRP